MVMIVTWIYIYIYTYISMHYIHIHIYIYMCVCVAKDTVPVSLVTYKNWAALQEVPSSCAKDSVAFFHHYLQIIHKLQVVEIKSSLYAILRI